MWVRSQAGETSHNCVEILFWILLQFGLIRGEQHSKDIKTKVHFKQKLSQYRESCASLVEGTTSTCSVSCQHALVGLISTAEGERLMDCTCHNTDCSLEKKRVEPCREEVIGV